MDSSPLCPEAILSFLRSNLGPKFLVSNVRQAKSAQQRVLILQCNNNDGDCSSTPSDSSEWKRALQTGQNRIVVRIWKGSARWWNLHSNEPGTGVVRMARAEVAGYRMARNALAETALHIPTILYFSHDKDTVQNYADPPWAILSYVGPESIFFDGDQRVHDTRWADCMVKIRREFGFDEPHPRWGRVPEDQCLQYSLMILDEFVIPMHDCFFSKNDRSQQLDWSHLGRTRDDQTEIPYQYLDMVQLYQTACSRLIAAMSALPEKDTKLETAIDALEVCLERLRKTTTTNRIPNVPPVLCHMDCQPQNLIFVCDKDEQSQDISSVLDWEEAAYADPRFELLLLCRKVCANSEQAKTLWRRYFEYMSQTYDLDMGPMEPWLQLETVHSITTLLLQTMDMLDGGRNPWERKPDLWGKIEREFQRLAQSGWDFCGAAVSTQNGCR
jgi:hypothetical protein